jgi:hypothetical protein
MEKPTSFQESLYSTDCVADAIEYIISDVFNGITEKWLRTLELPIAIEMAMLKMKKVVAWSVVTHDGDINGMKDEYLEKLEAEKEPSPVPIDPWARGTVPVRKEMTIEDFGMIDTLTSMSAPPTR